MNGTAGNSVALDSAKYTSLCEIFKKLTDEDLTKEGAPRVDAVNEQLGDAMTKAELLDYWNAYQGAIWQESQAKANSGNGNGNGEKVKVVEVATTNPSSSEDDVHDFRSKFVGPECIISTASGKTKKIFGSVEEIKQEISDLKKKSQVGILWAVIDDRPDAIILNNTYGPSWTERWMIKPEGAFHMILDKSPDMEGKAIQVKYGEWHPVLGHLGMKAYASFMLESGKDFKIYIKDDGGRGHNRFSNTIPLDKLKSQLDVGKLPKYDGSKKTKKAANPTVAAKAAAGPYLQQKANDLCNLQSMMEMMPDIDGIVFTEPVAAFDPNRKAIDVYTTTTVGETVIRMFVKADTSTVAEIVEKFSSDFKRWAIFEIGRFGDAITENPELAKCTLAYRPIGRETSVSFIWTPVADAGANADEQSSD
jgi:hypothetical protein